MMQLDGNATFDSLEFALAHIGSHRGALAPRPETELTWTRSTDSSLQKKIKKDQTLLLLWTTAQCRIHGWAVGAAGARLWGPEPGKNDSLSTNISGGGGENANGGRWLLTGSWNSSHSTIGCETHTIILTSEDCRLESRDFQDFSRFLELIINL